MRSVQRHNIPEFIQKVRMMIEKYPKTINWGQNGTELLIIKQNHLCKIVLPQFFRHDKIGSFVRQLNIYGFSKISWNKNILKFRHQYFKRGQQKNYHLIIRKKKEKTQIKQTILSKEEQIQNQLRQNLKDSLSELPNIIKTLFYFKNKHDKDIRQVKKQIDHLNKEVNPRQSKKVKPFIITLKQYIGQSSQIMLRSQQQINRLSTNSMICKQSMQFQEQKIECNFSKTEQYQLGFNYDRRQLQQSSTVPSQLVLQETLKRDIEDRRSTNIVQFQSISKFITTD